MRTTSSTGIVLMRKGENPSVVLDAVKEKVDALNDSVLPNGVQIVPFYDRTWLIGKTLKTVFTNLRRRRAAGDARAAGCSSATCARPRSSRSTIPLSLLATFLGLTFIGIPANLLSLGAMDFGIIVDGAVIVVENVFRKLSEAATRSTSRDELRNTILDATVEVGRPTLFSMLIIIAAHIPIFTLQRHEGRIFAPMA